jgi:hypothetical protein
MWLVNGAMKWMTLAWITLVCVAVGTVICSPIVWVNGSMLLASVAKSLEMAASITSHVITSIQMQMGTQSLSVQTLKVTIHFAVSNAGKASASRTKLTCLLISQLETLDFWKKKLTDSAVTRRILQMESPSLATCTANLISMLCLYENKSVTMNWWTKFF